MDTADWGTVGGGVLAGAVPAAAMTGWTGAIVGAAFGLVLGIAAARMKVRPVVALSVIAGTVLGALIGKSIAAALCRPGTCSAFEWLAAALTGIGAFVGVGLIVALATRSFDEYRERAPGTSD